MFLNGWLTGLAVGVAFMYYWRKLMREKRQERYLKAMDNASLAKIQSPDDIARILQTLPKWVQFGEYDQMAWFNLQLAELWPYVNKAVQGTIEETVEPMLKGYTGGVIADMQFTRTDLGNSAPEIRGAKVTSLQHNQLALDLDVHWQGDCKFKLAIVTLTRATVKPCVQNLSFTGTIRIILELTDKVPVVAAYMATIMRKTGGDDFDVDFKLTGAGLGAIPSLPTMIDDIIQSSVSNMMLWPNRITGAIIEGYDISHFEFRYCGAVVVTVVKCEGLKNMDTLGKSDPRVQVYCRDTHKFATKVVDNNLNPVYNEVFEIPVDDVHTAEIHFFVQDEDSIGVATTWAAMGCAAMPLDDIYRTSEEKTWTLELFNSLKAKDRTEEKFGTITFKAVYRSYDTDDERKEVTEREAKRKPTDIDKCLSPAEAEAARQRALASAKGRAQNRDAFKGVAAAAGTLITLQKETHLPKTKPAKEEAAGPPKGTPHSVSLPPEHVAPAPPKGTPHSESLPADLAASDPNSSGWPLAKIVSAPGTPAVDVAADGAPTIPAAAAAAAASAESTVAGAGGSHDGSQLSAASSAREAPLDASGSPPDDEKQAPKLKVPSFFKGMGSKMKEKLHMSMDAETLSERQPSDAAQASMPGSSTPRRSGLLGAFKKDKKAAEI